MKDGIFISYRRNTGSTMARMVYDRLRLEKQYHCFLDVETLNAGNFRDHIDSEMDRCDVFLLILTANALNRCSNPNDNVRQEILMAMEKNLTIIPITAEDFSWPDRMPEGLESIQNYNAIPYIQVYSEQFFERLYSFIETIRSERNTNMAPSVPEKNVSGQRQKKPAPLAVMLGTVAVAIVLITCLIIIPGLRKKSGSSVSPETPAVSETTGEVSDKQEEIKQSEEPSAQHTEDGTAEQKEKTEYTEEAFSDQTVDDATAQTEATASEPETAENGNLPASSLDYQLLSSKTMEAALKMLLAQTGPFRIVSSDQNQTLRVSLNEEQTMMTVEAVLDAAEKPDDRIVLTRDYQSEVAADCRLNENSIQSSEVRIPLSIIFDLMGPYSVLTEDQSQIVKVRATPDSNEMIVDYIPDAANHPTENMLFTWELHKSVSASSESQGQGQMEIGDDTFICGLVPFKENGKCGYLNTRGEVAIPAQWDGALPFDASGYAVVYQEERTSEEELVNKWFGVINQQGDYVFGPEKCQMPVIVSEENGRTCFGVCYATDTGTEMEYRTADGEVLGGRRWRGIGLSLDSSLTVVTDENQKEGYADFEHGIVIPCQFDDAAPFVSGLALVKTGDGQYAYINPDVEYLTGDWNCAFHFTEDGIARVFKGTVLWGGEEDELWEEEDELVEEEEGVLVEEFYQGRYAFINREGQLICKYIFDDAEDFDGGAAKVAFVDEDGNKVWNLLAPSGELLCNESYERIEKLDEGFFAGAKTDREGRTVWMLIGLSGELGGNVFQELGFFSEGLAPAAVLDDKGETSWGFVDHSGEFSIPPQWKDVWHFRNGYALVKAATIQGDRIGFVDLQGNVVIEPKFLEAGNFTQEGFASALMVDETETWLYNGIIRADGSFIPALTDVSAYTAGSEPWFWDNATRLEFSEGLAACYASNSMGYINEKGEWVIRPQWDSAGPFHDGAAIVRKDTYWAIIDPTGRIVYSPFYEEDSEGNMILILSW